jgi:hypothetical protein
MLRRMRPSGDANVKWVLATVVVLALVISPFAIAQGGGLLGGKRNPRSGAFKAETQVIANTSQFGMRYSNRARGTGGGALLGCRSQPGGTPQRQYPFLRSRNVGNGLAFEIVTGGPLGGTISVSGGDNARPFTTNATGVATGLNAERVGSKTPAQLTIDAVAAVQGTLSFARVLETGTAVAMRGVSAVARTAAGVYNVTFAGDVSRCGLSATQSAAGAEVGATGVQLGADNRTVTVTTMGTAASPAPADRGFYITAVC